MNRQNPYFTSIVSLSLAVVLVSGCGAGDGFKGQRGTVSGKITVEGTPAPKGSQVAFVGVSHGCLATGMVDEKGVYSLRLNGSANLPAIKYEVQISPPAQQATSADKKAATTKPSNPMAAMQTIIPSNIPQKTTTVVEAGPFPSKYSSVRTSKLSVEVKPGANSCDFDLDANKAKKSS